MTLFSRIFLVLLLSTCSVYASDKSELQKASRKLAALTAARGIINNMGSYDAPALVDDTKKAILLDTKIHSDRGDSEKICKGIYELRFDTVLKKNLSEILSKLDLDIPIEEFQTDVEEKFGEEKAENRTAFVNKELISIPEKNM